MRVMATGTVMVDVMAVGLSHVAEPGEVLYTNVETHIGGHPIDVAIDLVKLGYPTDSVAVAAALGTGPYGTFVREVIDSYGVNTFIQDVVDRDTGRNLVLEVAGEDRRFHLDAGANWVIDPDHVASALAGFEPDLLTLRPGYTGFDLALDEILAPLDSTTVLLDLMQPHPARPPEYIRDALRRADIVHCNEREARFNTGADTIEKAVAQLLDHGAELVLVTSGERGASAHTKRWEIGQPPFSVEVVDATGCGDAFCAGVIRRLAEAEPGAGLDLAPEELTELLLEGQAVGAAAATATGCVEGVTRGTVEDILAAQGEGVREQTVIVEQNR